MNKRITIGVAIMAIAAVAVQAANINSAAAGGLWSAPTTWTGGVVPGTNGVAGTDVARVVNNATVILNSTVPIQMGNVQVGRTTGGSGTLIVTNGASLNIISTMTLDVGSQVVGTFKMYGGDVSGKTFSVSSAAAADGSTAYIYGGNVSMTGTVSVGKAAAGTLEISGGSFLARDFAVGVAGANGFVNLLGGTTTLTGGSGGFVFNTAGSKLDIRNDATVIWDGNRMAVLNNLITVSNNVIWSSGSSTLGATLGVGDQTWTNGVNFLHADFDSAVAPGKTIIWVDAIPEPATIGMIGLGALITLLIRRIGARY